MFSICKTWMMHEGETKFYQAFKIMLKSKDRYTVIRECTVIHYGPTKSLRGKERRPVTGGAVVIYSGGEKYAEKTIEKAKRGYRSLDVTVTDYENDKIAEELTHLFGAANRDHILIQLGLSTSFGQDDDDGDECESVFDPSPELEDTSIDRFKDRPAAWGTW